MFITVNFPLNSSTLCNPLKINNNQENSSLLHQWAKKLEIKKKTTNNIITAKTQKLHLSLDSFIVGSLFILGLYHLSLFHLRKENRDSLLLALLSFSIAFQYIIIGEGELALTYLSNIPLSVYLFLSHGFFALSIYLFIELTKEIFPDYFRKSFFYLREFNITLALGFLVIKNDFFLYLSTTFVIITLIISTLILSRTTQLISNNKEKPILYTACLLFVFLSILNKISIDFKVLDHLDLTPISALFIVLSLSFLITKRFSNSYIQLEHAQNQIISLNKELESKVRERTLNLQNKQEQLLRINKELERNNFLLTSSHIRLEDLDKSKEEILVRVGNFSDQHLDHLKSYWKV